jgi:hypothetical protein
LGEKFSKFVLVWVCLEFLNHFYCQIFIQVHFFIPILPNIYTSSFFHIYLTKYFYKFIFSYLFYQIFLQVLFFISILSNIYYKFMASTFQSRFFPRNLIQLAGSGG